MRSMRTYSRKVYWNTLAFGIALLVGSVALLVALIWLMDEVPGHLHTIAGLLDALMLFFGAAYTLAGLYGLAKAKQ
jgi:ABC-type multidrug transport system fused ATPase/permease subunit